jgi:hypothetical protein
MSAAPFLLFTLYMKRLTPTQRVSALEVRCVAGAGAAAAERFQSVTMTPPVDRRTLVESDNTRMCYRVVPSIGKNSRSGPVYSYARGQAKQPRMRVKQAGKVYYIVDALSQEVALRENGRRFLARDGLCETHLTRPLSGGSVTSAEERDILLEEERLQWLSSCWHLSVQSSSWPF